MEGRDGCCTRISSQKQRIRLLSDSAFQGNLKKFTPTEFKLKNWSYSSCRFNEVIKAKETIEESRITSQSSRTNSMVISKGLEKKAEVNLLFVTLNEEAIVSRLKPWLTISARQTFSSCRWFRPDEPDGSAKFIVNILLTSACSDW